MASYALRWDPMHEELYAPFNNSRPVRPNCVLHSSTNEMRIALMLIISAMKQCLFAKCYSQFVFSPVLLLTDSSIQ